MTGSVAVLGTVIAHLLAASTFTVPQIDYTAILPELILLGGMLLIVAGSALSPVELTTEVYATATVGVGTASLVASLILWRDVTNHGAFVAVATSLDIDGFAVFFLVLVSCIIIVAALFAASYLRREGIGGCEYYALALISGSGAMFMATANDLILVFLGLEILSIPLYVLAGLDQRREASGEASMKYFVLGAFSSAIFVYGIALTYGATGSTNLGEIASFLAQNVLTHNGVLLAGLALLFVGFAFKVAAVPFHMWTPDVYQGAPAPATGFMAAMAKAGGFAALLRVFVSSFPTLRSSWQPIVWVVAICTVVLGAVLALVQRDVKRILAYSSINHAGFVLLGLQAATSQGVAGSLYYIFAYSFLVLGSFAVVAIVGARGDTDNDLARYRGLGRRRPVLAVAFAVLLLAQAGVPFTTGFFSKFYVVSAAVDAHSYALAAVAMGSAAVAAFFYLRIVFLMFADAGTAVPIGAVAAGGTLLDSEASADVLVPRSSGGLATLVAPADLAAAVVVSADDETLLLAEDAVPVSPWAIFGLVLCVGTTLLFGIWPQPLIEFAHQATLLF